MDITVLCGECTLPWERLDQLSSLANALERNVEPTSEFRKQLKTTLKGLQQADLVELLSIECPEITEARVFESGDKEGPIAFLRAIQALAIASVRMLDTRFTVSWV